MNDRGVRGTHSEIAVQKKVGTTTLIR